MSKKGKKAKKAQRAAELAKQQSRWKITIWINNHPLVATLVAITAVIASVFTVVYLIIDHLPVDPNTAVCRSIEATNLKFMGSAHDEDDDNWIVRERAAAAEHLAQATDGSDLEAALEMRIDVYDEIAAGVTGNLSNSELADSWFDHMTSAIGAEEAACENAGVRFAGSHIVETADGSITDADALAYCDSALDYLQSMASLSMTDQHLIESAMVLTNRADAGLPHDVFLATRELVLVYAEAMRGRGHPEGEAAANTIGDFCKSHGATDWPYAN